MQPRFSAHLAFQLVGRLALSVALWATAPCAQGEGWHGHAAVASEYSYRGLRIADDTAIPSVMLEYQHSSGFYGGVWAADLGDRTHRRGDRELNYLLGFAQELNTDFALDTTLIHYDYPTSPSPVDYDWNEWLVSLHYQQRVTLTIGTSDNWFGRDQTGRLVEITYRTVLPFEFTADASYGYGETEQLIGTDYHYYEIGINKALAGLRLRAALTGTGDRARRRFGARNTEARWLFSAAWGF